MNRLANETSPYLRQHAANPVDWYPWGEEALQTAQDQGKPILLSIGYSSCHWCHVMAHESFEHAETAAIMNAGFINIKVDREERPDVDDIYMKAVQRMNRGHGGWPLTVFLTPDGHPFYGGTYYPLEPRHGLPAFRQILAGVEDAWTTRQEEVLTAARELTNFLDQDDLAGLGGDAEMLNAALVDKAFQGFSGHVDWSNGGFGGAPKFPQPMNIEFMLRACQRYEAATALRIVEITLKKMARGGIYDQIGGGFARYSTDDAWLVPHFEKMLYDNAQLSRVYLHAWQVTGDDFYRRIAEETYDYILREMTSGEGGFYSATDADSEGVEGKFFVWDLAEIESILGEDAPLAIAYWGVTQGGNFEGKNILYVAEEDDATIAQGFGLSVPELHEKLTTIKQQLYAVRAQRIPPGLDDKILTAWNALMLASMAEAARVLKREDYRAAAVKNAEFLLGKLVGEDGRLLRTYNNGEAKLNAYLEDYAFLIDGLLALYQTTFQPRYFAQARRLADHVLDHFRAPDGGFYDTSDDHEDLIIRPRNIQDNAIPAGSSMMARVLLQLAAYTGEARYADTARAALTLITEAMRQVPQGFGEAVSALEMVVSGLQEVAIIGDPADAQTQALLDVVQGAYRPNVIVALSPQDVGEESEIPLLRSRTQRSDAPTVYVCQNFTCAAPVNTPEALAALLDDRTG